MGRRRPSEGQLRAQAKAARACAAKRKKPRAAREVDSLAAITAGDIQPGKVYSLTTLHDEHCERPKGGSCDCDPSGVMLAELDPAAADD